MARLSTAGWESQWLDGGTGTGGSFDTTIVRSGARSHRTTSGAGGTAGTATAGSSVNVDGTVTATYNWFARVYYYFENYPASEVGILTFSTWDGGASGTVRGVTLDSTGALRARVGTGVASSASTDIVSLNQWERIDVSISFAVTASTQRVETVNDVRLNGKALGLTCNRTGSTASPGGLVFLTVGWVDAPGTNKVVYVDDAAWNNDAAGTGQTSYPNPGKVVVLYPISDNARDTLWTGGSGGTTNLFDAVDNIPPAGTATETNTTQIEHAGGAAGTSDRYDANMTSYTTAGVKANDVVRVVSFGEVDGEDVATGAKLLNFEVLSNPAIASPGNVTAGDNVGALGTYTTNWSIRRNQTQSYNPSVTLGTSPVMRARRPETASRVASVCAMGMVVDYEPSLAPPFKPKFHRQRWTR